VAFVVHESTRRAGRAGFLLGELAATARDRGITGFWASVLPGNHPMSALLVRAGGVAGGEGEDLRYDMKVARILRWRSRYLEHKKIHRERR
jgi:hypothetical protein